MVSDALSRPADAAADPHPEANPEHPEPSHWRTVGEGQRVLCRAPQRERRKTPREPVESMPRRRECRRVLFHVGLGHLCHYRTIPPDTGASHHTIECPSCGGLTEFHVVAARDAA